MTTDLDGEARRVLENTFTGKGCKSFSHKGEKYNRV
jgi:hypothetical protein